MSRRFTRREKILLVILAVLLLVLVYYMLVYKPTEEAIYNAQSRQAAATEMMDTQTVLAQKMHQVESELDGLMAEEEGMIPVAPYDNTENIVKLLNGVLQGTESYTIDFQEVAKGDDSLYRRIVNMSVTCADYSQAKYILGSIHDCGYRCQIGNLSLAASEKDAYLGAGQVKLTFSVTFFEK